jgi:hypothetical protein
MEIKIQMFGKVYAILFGRSTAWYDSVYRFQVIREWYDSDRTVEYAELVFKV